mmetsp:Transcript_31246/g.90849  ORF Transcript_31246/g.90849 Transcript_31246/m.90849 type:complete len:296 (-) Transcript_31246:353-1240(-)
MEGRGLSPALQAAGNVHGQELACDSGVVVHQPVRYENSCGSTRWANHGHRERHGVPQGAEDRVPIGDIDALLRADHHAFPHTSEHHDSDDIEVPPGAWVLAVCFRPGNTPMLIMDLERGDHQVSLLGLLAATLREHVHHSLKLREPVGLLLEELHHHCELLFSTKAFSELGRELVQALGHDLVNGRKVRGLPTHGTMQPLERLLVLEEHKFVDIVRNHGRQGFRASNVSKLVGVELFTALGLHLEQQPVELLVLRLEPQSLSVCEGGLDGSAPGSLSGAESCPTFSPSRREVGGP